MKDAVFDAIREYVQERTRLSFTGHKRGLLLSRLHQRVESLSLPDMTAYRDLLASSSSEEAILYDLITTNETSFFRNPRQFQHLREHILPCLEEEQGSANFRLTAQGNTASHLNDMRLRILSAGCSTGEEPYTIAMTVLEGLRYPRAWNLEILAGDLSENCLATARRGFYDADRLKEVPSSLQEKYLEKSVGGSTFKDEVKRLINFMPLNLNDVMRGSGFPRYSSNDTFDIVFCRNVMIYFSPACQQLLVDTLYNVLAPGGYLFTGDAEPLHLFRHEFTPVREAGCLIYRKTETKAHVEAV